LDDAPTIPPPEGFVATRSRGPFSTHNGPYYERACEVGAEQAFFILPRHCNQMGIVHGGMLSAFMDGLLAAAIGRAAKGPGVTIHLSLDFLNMARAGEWAVGAAKCTRLTMDVAFAEGAVQVKGRDLIRGSGVFKLMRGRELGPRGD
jgi:acyl-coenzyme A thioesterase PaaI-like protein